MGGVRTLRVALFCFVVLLGGVAGVGVYSAIPKEPRYQGRSLSQWLEPGSRGNPYCYVYGIIRNDSPNIHYTGDPARLEVRNAVQAMGADALPFLTKWASAKDSKRKAELIAWLNARVSPRFHLWSAHERQNAAYIGFAFLQDKARPALPLFIAMTFEPDPDPDSYRQMYGLDCLVYCQPDENDLVSIIRKMIGRKDEETLDHLAVRLEYYYHDKAEVARLCQRFPQLEAPRRNWISPTNSVTVKSD